MAMITRLLAILLLMCSISWANQNQPSRIVEQDGKVQLNLNNVDVGVIIKYLARFSGEHYLIDPTVKGKISIMANKPVTRQEAIIILEEALIFNNFTIMKMVSPNMLFLQDSQNNMESKSRSEMLESGI